MTRERLEVVAWPNEGQPRPNNARNMGEGKETIAAWSLVGIDSDGAPTELAAARWYMSRSGHGASPVYCSVWIHANGHPSGHGRATGCGYCKRSAALAAAIQSAGITLSHDIDGRGQGHSREALEAIGHSLGHPEARVIGFGF